MEPIVICIANHKGGTGKTETVLRLALQFATLTDRPTLIDLDPQANLTSRCKGAAVGTHHIGSVLGGAVAAQCRLGSATQCLEVEDRMLHLVPADITLENVAAGLYQRNFGRLSALANAITADRHFLTGPVLIDTPPNAGILTLNALVAADYVIICADPEPDAIAGVNRIREIVAQIAQERERAPKILGTIATRVDAQLTRHQEGLRILQGSLMPPSLGIVPKRAGQDAAARLNEAYAPIARRILAGVGYVA